DSWRRLVPIGGKSRAIGGETQTISLTLRDQGIELVSAGKKETPKVTHPEGPLEGGAFPDPPPFPAVGQVLRRSPRLPDFPGPDAQAVETMARYVGASATVADYNTGDNPQAVPLAAKNLRLLFGEEALQNHVALKIAELRRTSDAKVALDEQFIPPAVTLGAS